MPARSTCLQRAVAWLTIWGCTYLDIPILLLDQDNVAVVLSPSGTMRLVAANGPKVYLTGLWGRAMMRCAADSHGTQPMHSALCDIVDLDEAEEVLDHETAIQLHQRIDHSYFQARIDA